MEFYEPQIEDILEPAEFSFEPLDNLPLPPPDGPGERGQDDSEPWPSPE